MYEGISSFLHHKRQKALHKSVKVKERKPDIQCNKIFHLEDTIIMYGIYNSDTLAELIETVHRMHNTTSWQERTFIGKRNQWFQLYLHQDGVGHYAINSVLFLTTIREKYGKMYERFLEQSKLSGILSVVRKAIQKTNNDYDFVLLYLYLYYDMKLVTFGIDEKKNLIIQFLVFVQPYTQKQLMLYCMETVLVPILGKNE